MTKHKTVRLTVPVTEQTFFMIRDAAAARGGNDKGKSQAVRAALKVAFEKWRPPTEPVGRIGLAGIVTRSGSYNVTAEQKEQFQSMVNWVPFTAGALFNELVQFGIKNREVKTVADAEEDYGDSSVLGPDPQGEATALSDEAEAGAGESAGEHDAPLPAAKG